MATAAASGGESVRVACGRALRARTALRPTACPFGLDEAIGRPALLRWARGLGEGLALSERAAETSSLLRWARDVALIDRGAEPLLLLHWARGSELGPYFALSRALAAFALGAGLYGGPALPTRNLPARKP